MDGTEDSSYLTLLNDGTNNYLLQTTEEALGVQDPSLNVEPMFTEIEDGSGAWSVGLPILMNSNLIPEAHDELEAPMTLPTEDNAVEATMDLPAGLKQIYEDSLDNREEISLKYEGRSVEHQMQYPIEIPGKGFITADGLFIANDLLLQLKLDPDGLDLVEQSSSASTKIPQEEQEDILINQQSLIAHNGHVVEANGVSKDVLTRDQDFQFNGDLNSHGNNTNLENEEIFDVSNLNSSNDIIQLLNVDGTVININKEHLLNYDVPKHQPVCPAHEAKETPLDDCVNNTDELFELVMAHKCRQCLFLCEKEDDMIEHLKNKHVRVHVPPLISIKEQSEEKASIIKESNFKIEEKNGVAKYNGEIKMKSILKNGNHQTVYLCSVCKLGYGSKEKLRCHMMLVHKLVHQPELKVSIDEKPGVVMNGTNGNNNKNLGIKGKTSAALIQKQAKASKKIKCSMKGCDLRFAMDEMRVRHEKCHVEGQKKQFKCYECESKFSLWRICSMHMWKCHELDLGLFTCPMCSIYKASSAMRLATHMAIHEEDKPYLCNDCGKTFKQHCQLRNHQVIHKNIEDAPDWATQQKCDICKKFFANSKSLKKHIQSVHDKFKPFICNICGHKTARKAMLELHLRQHTGEKPHRCTMCEYKTGDHNSLRRHIMRHSGDTKYSCPHCNYQSIQSTSYKHHIASKHPGLGGSYFCNLCSYHTVNENTYRSHLADHKNGLTKEICDNDGNNDELHKTTVSLDEEKSVSTDNQHKKRKVKDIEDDETDNYLLMLDHSNDAVDTGGITIPAGCELPVQL